MLSSIEGAAISSLKMDGVQHEFQSVDGVVEDITDIVLNLKKVLVISHKADPVTLTLEVEVKAKLRQRISHRQKALKSLIRNS